MSGYNIWLMARSHMASNYTWRPVTTHMILEVSWDGLWTMSFEPAQFHGHNSWLVCAVALRLLVVIAMHAQQLKNMSSRVEICCTHHNLFDGLSLSLAPPYHSKDKWPRPSIHHLTYHFQNTRHLNEIVEYMSPFISLQFQIHNRLLSSDCHREFAALSLGTWKKLREA